MAGQIVKITIRYISSLPINTVPGGARGCTEGGARGGSGGGVGGVVGGVFGWGGGATGGGLPPEDLPPVL